MPKEKAKRYRVVTSVSVRKSNRKSDAAWNEFLSWRAGEYLDDCPDYADFEGWLALGAIEEVSGVPAPKVVEVEAEEEEVDE